MTGVAEASAGRQRVDVLATVPNLCTQHTGARGEVPVRLRRARARAIIVEMDRNATTWALCVLLLGCSKQDAGARDDRSAGEPVHSREMPDREVGSDSPTPARSDLDAAGRSDDARALPREGSPGSRWFAGTMAQALARARELDREVLVDVGAAWCGPCQEVHEGAFADPSVRALLDARYVPIAVDAELGEGPELVAWFTVQTYPTFLRLDGKGRVVASLVEEIETAAVRDFLERSAPSAAARQEAAVRAASSPDAGEAQRRRHASMVYADQAAGGRPGAREILAALGSEVAVDGLERLDHWSGDLERQRAALAGLDAAAEGGAVLPTSRARRRAELAVSLGRAPEKAMAQLRAATPDSTVAAWTCAQLGAPAAPCLPWIPGDAGEPLTDAANADLRARLHEQLGQRDAARVEAAKAARLAPGVHAYVERWRRLEGAP